jgi:hypothetical protein
MSEIDVTKVSAIEYLEKFIEIVNEEACRDYIDCEDCKYHNISCVSTEELADIGAENHIRSVMMFGTKDKPGVDWTKVEKDTLIEVRENNSAPWTKRYFAKYQYGKVYVYINGCTSKTESKIIDWEFARLADED